MLLKLLQKKAIQTIAEATGDLIGNKRANKIIKVSRNSQQEKVQGQLQMKQQTFEMIKKYLKKKVYLHEKDRKLLMI